MTHRFAKAAVAAVALLIVLMGAATTLHAETIIGDVASPQEGFLRIHVHDDGTMEVWRYRGGGWEYQFYGQDAKGARLQADGTGYGLGYFSGTGTGTVTLVSNTRISDTKITAVWQAGDFRVTLEVDYQPGAAFYSLRWTIVNQGSGSAGDLRFFHGGDTYFEGDDRGGGFWDAPNNTVGVQHTSGEDITRMSLQGSTVPFAYDSQNYWTMAQNVNAGALTNTIDPNEDTDNGYALEWRRSSLAPGDTWTIQAFEKFGDATVGGPLVFGPTQTDGAIGGSVDLTFTVQNTSPEALATTLAVTVDRAGWTAAVTAPASPVTIAGNGDRQVTVRVTVPATAAAEDLANVELTATANSISAADNAVVRAAGGTPQPPPDETFTSATQPGGNTVAFYRMTSVPLDGVDGSGVDAAVYSGMGGMDVGPTGDARVLFFENGAYRDLVRTTTAATPVDNITDLAGVGFWRIVRRATAFTYEGDNPPDDPFEMLLGSGWHMIGFPFNDVAQIAVDTLMVRADDDTVQLTDPANNPYTGNTLWAYAPVNAGAVTPAQDGSQHYDPADVIAKGLSYWLYVYDTPVTLIIPRPHATSQSAGARGAAAARIPAAGEPLPPAPPAGALATGAAAGGAGGGCFIRSAAGEPSR